MIEGETVVAVIPARGGSRRAPRKNARSYHGKPLIQWAVESARASKYIDHFCVSSEDEEILEIARKCRATALKRPEWLATNTAMCEGVMVDALYTWKWAKWAVLLQPTSPQRTGEDIDECIRRAKHGHGMGCISYDEYMKRNGAVYVVNTELFIASICFSKDAFPDYYLMPNERSLDIDYEVDFQR